MSTLSNKIKVEDQLSAVSLNSESAKHLNDIVNFILLELHYTKFTCSLQNVNRKKISLYCIFKRNSQGDKCITFHKRDPDRGAQ